MTSKCILNEVATLSPAVNRGDLLGVVEDIFTLLMYYVCVVKYFKKY